MARRMMVVVLITTHLLLVAGCSMTKEVKLFKEEIEMGEEKILEVVLDGYEVVKFAENGGKLKLVGPFIVGKTESGRKLSLELDAVQELRKNSGQSVPVSQIAGQKIVEVVLNNALLYQFTDEGGRYDAVSESVIGTTRGGDQFNLKLSKIRDFRTRLADTVSRHELALMPSLPIAELVTKSRELVKFNTNGGHIVEPRRVISGITASRKSVEIDADNVLYALVSRTDPVGVVLTVFGVIIGVATVIVLIILATKQSCPFVYSFDGQHYVFDAEPLGGAVSAGLARTEISRLELLRAVSGQYRLLIRNEVEETQHLDEMKVLVVDHAADAEVYPDQAGTFHVVKHQIRPISARDENGTDLLKAVCENDGIMWQTRMPTDTSFRQHGTRHQLTFQFLKPRNATSARLLFNGGTSQWGSNMIRKMLEMRGSQADEWYRQIDSRDRQYYEMFGFLEREELFTMKIHVKEGDHWRAKEYVQGGGPLIYEDRAVPISLSHVNGDTLTIRFDPPRGFWAINYLGIEYGPTSRVEGQECKIASGTDQDGREIGGLLEENDGREYVMSDVGDWAKVSFNVPPPKDGARRSIFLKTSGYYKLHLPPGRTQQVAYLEKIASKPGDIVRFALEQYLEWRRLVLAGN
jgi:hypothetical protein